MVVSGRVEIWLGTVAGGKKTRVHYRKNISNGPERRFRSEDVEWQVNQDIYRQYNLLNTDFPRLWLLIAVSQHRQWKSIL